MLLNFDLYLFIIFDVWCNIHIAYVALISYPNTYLILFVSQLETRQISRSIDNSTQVRLL